MAAQKSPSETMIVKPNIDVFDASNVSKFIPRPVTIAPPSPNNSYTVEVQRQLSITCIAGDPNDIVAWIRKVLLITP